MRQNLVRVLMMERNTLSGWVPIPSAGPQKVAVALPVTRTVPTLVLKSQRPRMDVLRSVLIQCILADIVTIHIQFSHSESL